MKNAIIYTISLLVFSISYAQEIKTTIVVDSAQVKMNASKSIIEDRKAQLKADKKDQKDIRFEQNRADKKSTMERKELAKKQKQLKKDQREVQSENRAIENTNRDLNKANSTEIKLNERLIKANKKLVKAQSKFEKAQSRGNLTPVEKSEFELDITKKQLKVKEIEEDIANLSTTK